MTHNRIPALLMVLLLLAGSGSACAEILKLPMDFSGGTKPQRAYEIGLPEYQDPSIHVTITSGEMHSTCYWIARIKIANASQLRTHMDGSFKRKAERNIKYHYSKVLPVLCMDGDNFPERDGVGYVARQGEVLLRSSNKTIGARSNSDYARKGEKRHLDVLIIDDQGDLHIIKQATNEDVEAFEGKIVQAFSFGPALVIDGVYQKDAIVDLGNGPLVPARRVCIAQTGPLEYVCMISEGPEDSRGKKGKGMTIPEFMEALATVEGVQNAYMLDGGSAAGMMFKGEPVNIYQKKSRQVKDIIYFASAYVPDKEDTAP